MEPEALRAAPLFAGLSDERLGWLAERGSERSLQPGEALFSEGDVAREFFIVLDGELEAVKHIDGDESPVMRHEPGGFIGGIPLLTGEPYMASSRALRPSTVAVFGRACFDTLVAEEPRIAQTLLKVFAPALSNIEGVVRQREKLAALGTMAAGLAHELNNPAAAARHSATELGHALSALQETLGRFVESGVERAEAEQLVALQRAAVAGASDRAPLEALDAADREEELAIALEDRGVADPWPLAAALSAAGLDESWLEQVAELAGDAFEAALEWVAASLTASGLVHELHDSTARVSDLVRAVKDYTYMDQAPQGEVDVHAGLESTLTMLGHKLKQGEVRLVREYDPALPPIDAYGSELNQVWTNLLDNAIDAVAGQGTITVRTMADGDHVRVEIADDGPGVPPELQRRIFEPFFTTKGVGSGTGLGLGISHRIVVVRHHGDLWVESRPGETRFHVRLPVHQRAPEDDHEDSSRPGGHDGSDG